MGVVRGVVMGRAHSHELCDKFARPTVACAPFQVSHHSGLSKFVTLLTIFLFQMMQN